MYYRGTARGMVLYFVGLFGLTMAGCASVISPEPASDISSPAYRPYQKLLDLPPPARNIAVAVYRYDDKTGQFKPSQPAQTLSRAVTQGAASILVQALQNAGRGSWFTIVERENLKNLLTERKIITDMRSRYLSPEGRKLPPIGPMLYAGIIFEGGIIGFDSNTLTGGVGARYLGIGGNAEYRQDVVTVYLRAISTKNGAILKSVMTTKKILSYLVRADVFKFIDFAKLLEVEAGYTTNEPGVFALKKAIEKAVYLMVMEGVAADLWAFRDPEQGRKALQAYREEEYDDTDSPAPQAGAPPPVEPATKSVARAPKQTQSLAPERIAAAASPVKPPPTIVRSNAQARLPSRAMRQPTTKNANGQSRGAVDVDSSYAVQLASTRSKRGVLSTWSRLSRAYPDLFDGIRPAVARKDLGSEKGTWYRLLVGPFGNMLAAGRFCSRVKQRKLDCRVMRR